MSGMHGKQFESLSRRDLSIALYLWNMGNDTLTIAEKLNRHESVIYRELGQCTEIHPRSVKSRGSAM